MHLMSNVSKSLISTLFRSIVFLNERAHSTFWGRLNLARKQTRFNILSQYNNVVNYFFVPERYTWLQWTISFWCLGHGSLSPISIACPNRSFHAQLHWSKSNKLSSHPTWWIWRFPNGLPQLEKYSLCCNGYLVLNSGMKRNPHWVRYNF